MNGVTAISLAMFFVVAATPSSPVLAAPENLSGSASAYLEAIAADDEPGVAAIVAVNGETVFASARGLSDVDSKRPLKADQSFPIGSVSKVFVAATILKLVEEKRLSLADPVANFYPRLAGQSGMTVGNLLNHSSGLARGLGRDWADVAKADKLWSIDDLLEKVDPKLAFKPGTAQAYSNAGYVILGGILEKVTGKPWHEAVREKVLAPAGITSIRFQPDRSKLRGTPIGYFSDGSEAFPGTRYYVAQEPATALVADLEGLSRWFFALYGGKILSPESLALMSDWTRLDDGTLGAFGYGFQRFDVQDVVGVGHSGRIPGFGSNLAYFPAQRVFVAILSNNDDTTVPLPLATAMLAGMALERPFARPQAASIPLGSGSDWVGRYGVGDRAVDFDLDEHGYHLRSKHGTNELLFPAGDGVFFPPNAVATKWLRVSSAKGERTIEWHDGATVSTMQRSGDIPRPPGDQTGLAPATIQALAGTYQFPVGTFEIRRNHDGSLTGLLQGQPPVKLEPAGDGRLAVPAVDATIDYAISRSGQVESLRLSQGGQEIDGKRVAD